MDGIAPRQDNAIAQLESASLRITPQRLAVLRTLTDELHHPTAEEVYSTLSTRVPRISLATVYNTLHSFVETGIVRELRADNGATRYDANQRIHHHLICERCGSIRDVDLPPQSFADAAACCDFQMTSYHVDIRGICHVCAAVTCETSTSPT